MNMINIADFRNYKTIAAIVVAFLVSGCTAVTSFNRSDTISVKASSTLFLSPLQGVANKTVRVRVSGTAGREIVDSIQRSVIGALAGRYTVVPSHLPSDYTLQLVVKETVQSEKPLAQNALNFAFAGTAIGGSLSVLGQITDSDVIEDLGDVIAVGSTIASLASFFSKARYMSLVTDIRVLEHNSSAPGHSVGEVVSNSEYTRYSTPIYNEPDDTVAYFTTVVASTNQAIPKKQFGEASVHLAERIGRTVGSLLP